MKYHLLDLAVDLTRQAGRPPTLTELAAASGASRATVYRAFANQEGLIAQLRARGEAVPMESQAIFDAVRDVLLTHGLDGYSLEAVALRSGVSVATLYRRFGGRDELLFGFLDQLAPRMEAWRLADDGSAEDVLGDFAAQLSAWIVANAPLLIVAVSASPQTRERLRALRATSVGTHEALADWLRRRGEAAGRVLPEPLHAAQAFLGAVLGLSAAGPLTPDAARWWARTFLRGLGVA